MNFAPDFGLLEPSCLQNLHKKKWSTILIEKHFPNLVHSKKRGQLLKNEEKNASAMLKWVHQSSPLPKSHVTSGLAASSTSSSIGSTGSEEENDNKRNFRCELRNGDVLDERRKKSKNEFDEEDEYHYNEDEVEIVINENFANQSRRLRASSRFEVVLIFAFAPLDTRTLA